MMRKALALASAAILLAPTAAAVAAPAIAAISANDGARVIRVSTRGGANQSITLGLNKAAVIELDSDVKDVIVSSPDIADAVVKSPRRIFIMAAKVGQTNAFFLDANGRHLLALDIRVERDTADLDQLMATTMPKSSIKVTAMADNVVLSGSVPSATEANRAATLAAAFTGDPKKVINMLSVAGGEQVMLKVRVAEMSRSIAKQFSINASGAVNVGGVPILASTSNPYGLLGHALSDASGGQFGSACGASQFLPTVTQAISNAATTGYQTDLVVDPVTKTNILLPTNPLSFETAQQATNSLNNSVTNSTNKTLCPNNAQGILNGLEQIGLVHMLAEPNLTAVSGETAKTHVGGEFPVPTAKDNQGNVTISFKPFGVSLSFTPVVLAPDRISIQMSSEVSELSNTGAYTLQGGTSTVNGVTVTTPGLTIPALATRQNETTVEMASGESIAIAGLLQHNTSQVIDGFPGAKDLPVLGALFRSRDFSNDETELVVLISAYLVEPTSEAKLSAPTDGFVPPSDPETLLLGRLNAVYKDKAKPENAKAANAAPGGFIVQ